MTVIPSLYPVPKQEKELWCWAAVSNYVADTLGSGPGQCGVAKLCIPTACSGVCAEPDCDTEHFLESALQAVGHFGHGIVGPLTSAQVLKEIDAGRPVGVRIEWSGQGVGHFLAIFGYIVMGASPSYYVYDPAHGSLDVVSPYSLTHSYQATGKWTHSYFTA